MLATLAYTAFPELSVGPMVLFTLTLLYIIFSLFKYPSTRNSVGYSALIGALSGFIYNTIIMAKFHMEINSGSGINFAPCFVFYGIYISFAFVPGLIGFNRIAKKYESSLGKFFINFGYFWAFTTMVIGLALTIYISVKIRWAFVAVFLVLPGSSRGKTPLSLTVYSWLNIVVVLVNTILASVHVKGENVSAILNTFFAITFVFCDIPVALALTIAASHAGFWKQNSITHDEENNNEKTEISVGGEEDTKLQV
ncbi:unnamed protein product [Mucor hiemalis]